MYKITFYQWLLGAVILCITCMGCKKFLDKKPNEKLVIPTTIQDLQALLDQYARVNQFNPGAAEKSADDYYLTTADWEGLTVNTDKRMYVWEPDNLFSEGLSNDWAVAYQNVYRANTVLYESGKIEKTAANTLAWNTCLGHAYFTRANMFLKVATIWAPAYDKNTAASDMGIPLRLDPDFNVQSVRASVKETYAAIISDAREAAALLPETAIHLLRPARPAALALLARTFLAMGMYDSCMKYSTAALALNNQLTNFNTLNLAANYPFAPRFSSVEILMDSYMNAAGPVSNTRAKIDSVLYDSYETNDLRKQAFFRSNNNGTYRHKGSYSGSSSLFDGFSTNELYLMQAECNARLGFLPEAAASLNALLLTRWRTGTFVPFVFNDATEAKAIILQERRKELIMRGLRWMDIKRLNVEGAGIVLQRVLNGETITLMPNDKRYALPIPENVIRLSGMPQNRR